MCAESSLVYFFIFFLVFYFFSLILRKLLLARNVDDTRNIRINWYFYGLFYWAILHWKKIVFVFHKMWYLDNIWNVCHWIFNVKYYCCFQFNVSWIKIIFYTWDKQHISFNTGYGRLATIFLKSRKSLTIFRWQLFCSDIAHRSKEYINILTIQQECTNVHSEHGEIKLLDKLYCWHNERSFVSRIRVA